MKATLDALSREELLVLARIRLALTVHLAAIAGEAEAEAELRERATRRPFILSLSAPGLPPAYLRSDGKALRAFSGGARPPVGFPDLTLRFPSPRSAARVLGGGGGRPLPILRGPGGLAALGFFRKAAGRVPLLLAGGEAPLELRARLLAAAALQGLAEVGNADPWLSARLGHVPDGRVAVEAPGAFSFTLEKRAGLFSLAWGAPEKPNARLSFRDAPAALALFSGARPAVLALGAGEVSLGGLLPLAQGLFAVLDRLGDYLAVKAK